MKRKIFILLENPPVTDDFHISSEQPATSQPEELQHNCTGSLKIFVKASKLPHFNLLSRYPLGTSWRHVHLA